MLFCYLAKDYVNFRIVINTPYVHIISRCTYVLRFRAHFRAACKKSCHIRIIVWKIYTAYFQQLQKITVIRVEMYLTWQNYDKLL